MNGSNMTRWSLEQVTDWYGQQPWLCGFNYLPRTAVNWIDLWQAESFDAATIERELALAGSVGFNTLRTNLHSLVWLDDAAGLRSRIDDFLGIASRNGIRTLLCPFDDCGFSGREPRLGRQDDPIPGVHNSRACASPGRAIVRDSTQWSDLQRYIADIVGHFRDDARILAWDLYNEPGNDSVLVPGEESPPSESLRPSSTELVKSTFAWARGARPTQPLTTGIWQPGWTDQNELLIELSDFISFHNYFAIESLRAQVKDLKRHDRPLMCTEWLARGFRSVPDTHLPYFAAERIGCYHWGLVNGRTQTHLPWPGFGQLAKDGTWHHDLFRSDGTPYDPAEIDLFRSTVRGSVPPQQAS